MLVDLLLEEMAEEAVTTRKVLERVPAEKLSWRPHEKSLSLGQLALHIAILPGELARFFSQSVQEIPTVPFPEAASCDELMQAYNQSMELAKQTISSWSEEHVWANFTLTQKGEPILTVPRIKMVRHTLFNHWYHHRAQLTVYFRLLHIPVPAVYGSSADEG